MIIDHTAAGLPLTISTRRPVFPNRGTRAPHGGRSTSRGYKEAQGAGGEFRSTDTGMKIQIEAKSNFLHQNLQIDTTFSQFTSVEMYKF